MSDPVTMSTAAYVYFACMNCGLGICIGVQATLIVQAFMQGKRPWPWKETP